MFEEQKLTLEMKYRPFLPWHEEFQNIMDISNLLSINNYSKSTFEKFQELKTFSKGILYFINSPICTDYGQFDFCPISEIDAIELANIYSKKEIKSAIGHKGTSDYLTEIFKTKIELNRIEISMQPGDIAITLKIPRQEIGKDLSAQDMQMLNPQLGLLKRIL